MPLIVLLVFATLEVADMMYLKQTLYTTAYEGARVAIRPGAKTSDVNRQCQAILAARGVAGGKITMEPPVIDSQSRGTTLAVTVQAPSGSNTKGPAWFFGGKPMQARTVMVKE